MKSLSDHTDLPYKLVTSLLISGIHVGEISKLGCLIGFVKHAIWEDSFISFTPAVTFDFQNPGFMPAYLMTFFMGMLGQF
jgi:hypothetical protein